MTGIRITSPLPVGLQNLSAVRPVRGVDLSWAVAAPGFALADGRRFDAVVAGAVNTWRAGGGQIQLQRLSDMWAWFGDGGGRPRLPGAADDVAALCRHAHARALTVGLEQPCLLLDDPEHDRLGCHLAVADAAVVVMAALDRYLTGSTQLLSWYLESSCNRMLCRHHQDQADPARSPVLESMFLQFTDLPTPQWHEEPGPAHTFPSTLEATDA